MEGGDGGGRERGGGRGRGREGGWFEAKMVLWSCYSLGVVRCDVRNMREQAFHIWRAD